MNFQYKEIEINEVLHYGITLDEFPGAMFIVDSCSFQEQDDHAKLVYNYYIVEGEAPKDVKRFENAIGDFIMWYIENAAEMSAPPVVFKGGT